VSYQNEYIIPLCIGLSQVFHIDLNAYAVDASR
jgi:hypothetical protein